MAQRDDVVYSGSDPAVQNMGDGASIAVLKIVPQDDLIEPDFVKAYLPLATTAFSDPKLTFCAEDKSPEVTLFLLNYLREKVNDEDLRRQIDSTKQYVLKQTAIDSKPSGNDFRYTRVTSGLGFLDGLDGVGSALYSYRAPDGQIIGTEKATIGSADGVFAKTFHQQIDHSVAKIIDQEDILEESGKVIGYRSVLNLVDKDGTKSTAIVITKGADFLQLTSASAADVLAFEEEYNKEIAAKRAKQ